MTLAAAPVRRKGSSPEGDGAQTLAAQLLAWYDRQRRVLPWRPAPGIRPDPYRVWLSEIMLQQTTVKAVAPYFMRFIARWDNVEALAAAPLEEVLSAWAGLGYYARARNLHVCAKAVVEHHAGQFPASEAELAALPGIGPYTAAAIAAIAFDLPAAAVDGNVERVVARIFAVAQELPAAKPQLRELTQTLVPQRRAGDFAQALMDLGATICTPRRPACSLCPWFEPCAARRRGEPEAFPRKGARPQRRLRHGAAFVVISQDERLLLRSRPPRGLLGGMTEVPTSEWRDDLTQHDLLAAAPPIAVPGWRRVAGHVNHVFTHFPLQLTVYLAQVKAGTPAPPGMRWVALADLDTQPLPSVMRKVVAHALPAALAPGVMAAAKQTGRRAR
ncbi:MAG: A/G-specific adenine glycosylase [Xanthobacteraceae bacterium]